MPSALTPIDVANMALGILVEAPINSLDDNDKPARLLDLHFETTRQAELIKQAWSFAIFRTELTSLESVDVPAGSVYNYAFEVPEDALRVLPLTETGEVHGVPISWKLEGGLILSDYASPMLVRYIGNLTDPADWNPLFVEALAARLAMKIAMPLTNKPSVLQGAKLVYEEAIAEERRINAIERGSGAVLQSWANARGDTSVNP
jgi:hypothetical protein